MKTRKVEVIERSPSADSGITVVLVRLEYRMEGDRWRKVQAKGVAIWNPSDRWSRRVGLREAVKHALLSMPHSVGAVVCRAVWEAAVPMIKEADG